MRETAFLLTMRDGSSIERGATITGIRLAAFELLRSREEIIAGRDTMLQWYLPFGQANLTRHLMELRNTHPT
ncbi:hypothetical protein Brsp01_50270 [Brucella sp. NBRC 12950]|nr:hypothetical protein Brsp01_50270 [Brucella sp. NBRC 12950]